MRRTAVVLVAVCGLCAAVAGRSLVWPGAPDDPPTPLERLPAGRINEEWIFASETSAVLYWQTENRARSHVQYGPTPACAERTPLADVSSVSGQPCWTHFHRLRDLRPQSRYYFRLVCEGTDGTTTQSEVKTFETRRLPQAVRIPDDLPGPPYVLDRPGATYVLTRDLTFALGGLLVRAEGITLDMDGHTLVYNDEASVRPTQWDKRAYEEHDFGIKVAQRTHTRILNGTIRQGRGNSPGSPVGVGCNPIYCGGGSAEIAGVEIVWSGDDVSGFFLHDTQDDHIHHCVIDDQGSGVSDRHMGIRAIGGNLWGDYDHNLVKAARQQGLAGGVRVAHNEIYLRSCATNSFGVTGAAKAGKPVEIAFNHIVGIGEHPVGIGMFGAFAPGSTVHHNRVEVECTRRGAEFGYAGSACFRTTWGADNLDVGDNTFIAHAGRYGAEVAKARAIWVGLPAFAPREGGDKIRDARALFHNNRIIARGPQGAMAGAICVVCLNESPHLIFRDNDVTSTWGNVLLADSYGHADGYAKFLGNVFRREGRNADYHTIRQEYGGIPATGALLHNECQAGADLQDVRLLAGGRIVFLETLDVVVQDQRQQPIPDARVEIADNSSRQVFLDVTPEADAPAMLVSHEGPRLAVERPPRTNDRGYILPLVLAKGQVRAILPSVEVRDSGRSAPATYSVRARKPGFRDAVEQVQLDRRRIVRLVLVKD
jgi:hypothetical protein